MPETTHASFTTVNIFRSGIFYVDYNQNKMSLILVANMVSFGRLFHSADGQAGDGRWVESHGTRRSLINKPDYVVQFIS